MAELINEKDSLNKGRIKINEGIKASERAEDKSDEALSTANTAKSTADTTRYEMQAIIREQTAGGDIVPEVVQARGAEASLGNRLNSIDSDLAQTETDLEQRGINAWNFRNLIPSYNAITQSDWDWYPAIQAAIDYARTKGGGKVFLPSGTLKVSQSPKVINANVFLVGTGKGTELFYIGDYFDSSSGENGLGVVIFKPPTPAQGMGMRNITLNGNHKTLWNVYAERAYGFTMDNVKLKRSAGFIRTDNCYNSKFDNLLLEYSTASKPAEISQADWDKVKNFGLIYTTLGNGDKFGSVKVYGMGTIDVSARSLFYINAQTTEINTLTIERDNLYLNDLEESGKTAINHLFWVVGGNINITTLYLEHLNILSVLTSTAPGNHNIKIGNIFLNLFNIYYYMFQLLAGKSFEIEHIYILADKIDAPRFVHYGSDNKANALKNPILWVGNATNIKTINGKRYSDPKFTTSGIQSSNGYVMRSEANPSIENGFEVVSGEDEVGYFIAISPGSLTNHIGELVQLGIHTGGNVDTGWILRPDLSTNASYNICIDVYGGVYIERTIYAADKRTGKIIIAELHVGETLNEKTLTRI